MLTRYLLLCLLVHSRKTVSGDETSATRSVPSTSPTVSPSQEAIQPSQLTSTPTTTTTTTTTPTTPTPTTPPPSTPPPHDAWRPTAWLQEMSAFPTSYSFRNEVYNRPFRYRGELLNKHDAYSLWFDCLKAEQAPPLAEGPMLTTEGHAYCHRLGHRIAKEQRGRLNPRHPTIYKVEHIPVPPRDIFLEQYSIPSRPVVVQSLSITMIPQRAEQSDNPAPSPLALCLAQHPHVSTFSLSKVCSKAMVQGYFVPAFMVEDVLQSIRFQMDGIAGEASIQTPHWPVVWQTTDSESTASMPLTQAPHGAHMVHAVLQGTIQVRLYAPQEQHKLFPAVHKGGARSYKGGHQDETFMYAALVVSAPDAVFVPSGFVYEWEAMDSVAAVVVSHGFVDAGALNHLKDEGELEWNHPSFTSALSTPRVAPPTSAAPPTSTTSTTTSTTPATSATPLPPPTPNTYMRTARMLSNMHGKNVPFARSRLTAMPWLEYVQQGIAPHNNNKNTQGNEEALPKKKHPKKKQYREWRMQKTWEKRMLGLIPATPTIEKILYVGWEYVKVKVSLPYDAESTFHSIHQGFVMTWSSMNNYTAMQNHNATGSHEMTMHNHCRQEIKTAAADAADAADGADAAPPSPITYYICGCKILHPGSQYAIRLASLTSTAVGSSSPAVAVVTHALSVPPVLDVPSSCGVHSIAYNNVDNTKRNTPAMCISVRAPNDSGGRPILAFIYRWRRAGRYHTFTHTPWRFTVSTEELNVVEAVAPLVQRTLHNLIPNATLVVQVAVENELGSSPWSEGVYINTSSTPQHDSHVSIVIHETSLSPDFTEIGEVDVKLLPLHVQERRQLEQAKEYENRGGHYNQENENGTPEVGEVGVLSTRLHTLTIVRHDGASTIDVVLHGWRLHHAPMSHDVRASLVIADPMDASEEHFYNDIQGKIVLIERGGGVPFRDKVRRAQVAGALAVVLMDNTGKCTDDWHQSCVPGGSKHNGEGFAREDKASSWEGIETPTLMITSKDAELIKQFVPSPLM